jgi:molecular chaperone DnaJ
MELYAILGLERGAGDAEIRRAYRRLARRFHPGINPGDREARARFDQITAAFETLGDPERRRAYDQGAAPAAAPADYSFGFEGFDFSVELGGDQPASTFGDLFADVLVRTVGAIRTGAPEAGSDLHTALTLSFEEVMRGTERFVTLTRQVPCRTCAGRGVLAVPLSVCPACHGRGQIRTARGHMVFSKACEGCDGTGQRSEAACRTCRGEGFEASAESLRVQVPAGVHDGAQVRVGGRGHAGRRGGRAGDLVVSVTVAPHRLFRRDGDDLHLVVPVALHEAALGAKIDVPTFDGPVRLRVPPGTASGQRLRLREHGAPSVRTGARGDLIVEVRIVMPPLLDERSKELLREFGRINAEDVRQGLWSDQA